MNILEIKNLSISFGGLRAVDKVTMEVKRGEIRGLIGPNGAGKTTLFNLITGVYSPDEGEVFFNGFDLTKLKTHRIAELGIARTFQNLEIFNSMTVLENVMVGMHYHLKTGFFGSCLNLGRAKREEQEARRKAFEILKFIGLEEFHDRPASNLSFGQQRLLELARTLAMEPTIMLLDEPAAGIHPNKIVEIDNLLNRLRDEMEITIIVVEHVLKLVMSISDKITVLDHGAKIAEGKPGEIKDNIGVIEAYLGREEETDIAS
jgi:branched-chain amino acid transport system ATP-binding protein